MRETQSKSGPLLITAWIFADKVTLYKYVIYLLLLYQYHDGDFIPDKTY